MVDSKLYCNEVAFCTTSFLGSWNIVSFGRTGCDHWAPAGDHGRSESAVDYSAG